MGGGDKRWMGEGGGGGGGGGIWDHNICFDGISTETIS